MAFNDIYRLRVYARLHGGQVVNVLHFVEDVAVGGGTGAQALANDFMTNMRVPLTGRAVNQMQFDFVEVQSIVPFSNAPAIANFPANTLGTVGGSTASGTLAEVITVYTSRAGRRGRGRIYLAGGNTDLNPPVNGLWAGAQTARTQAFATALATRYMSVPYVTSFALGVWSKATAGPVPPWPTDAFVRANSLTVRTIIRNQRRRQVGVGR